MPDAPDSTVTYVEHLPDELPQHWTAERVAEHMTQRLRHIAREGGRDLIEGTAREVARRQSLVDTDFGQKAATTVTWEAATEPMPEVDGSIVSAVEQGDGTYLASVPQGTAILDVRHGLGASPLVVRAYAADGQETPPPGIVPVAPGEIELVLATPADTIVIEAAPQGDDA